MILAAVNIAHCYTYVIFKYHGQYIVRYQTDAQIDDVSCIFALTTSNSPKFPSAKFVNCGYSENKHLSSVDPKIGSRLIDKLCNRINDNTEYEKCEAKIE